MKFSIIIPTRRVNSYLRESLTNLKKLAYDNFEVIIVLDEEDIEFSKKNSSAKFKFLAVGSKSPGEKRNIGAKQATGEIIAFLDDDAFPSKQWLSEAKKVFERDPDLYALGAPAVTPPNAQFLEKCSGKVLETRLTSGSTSYRHFPGRRRAIDDYPAVNLFVKRKAFLAVGGFTKDFWPGEDTKLCLDLVRHHKRKFLYDAAPVVFHHRRGLFHAHLQQISRYAQTRGRFAIKFPKNSRVLWYFVPSLFVLGLLGGPLFIPMISNYLKDSLVALNLWTIYLSAIAFYLFLVGWVMFRVIFLDRDRSFGMGIVVGLGIIATHVVYGIYFLVGLFKTPILKLRQVDPETGDYLRG